LGEADSKKMVEVVSETKSALPDHIDYSSYQFEREILDSAFDAIFVHTLDGKLIEVNGTACRRLGYSRGELVNKEREELVALALVGSMPEYIELIKRDGELSFESVSITESGELIPVEVRAKLIKFKGEDAVLTFSRDLTEQKEKEDAARNKLEALHRHAVNLSRLYSIENVAEYSFDIIEELLGLVKGAIGVVDVDCIRFVFSRDVPLENIPSLPLSGRGITVRAIRTGETQFIGNTRLDPDYVSDIQGPELLSELDVPVKVNGIVAAVINLQAEKENCFTNEDRRIVEILSEHISSAMARIELLKCTKESEGKWRKLLESSLDSVLVLTGTEIAYANKKLATMLGYDDPSELIGKDVEVTLADDEKERIRGITLSRQRGEAQPDSYEVKLVSKRGRIIHVETMVNVIEFDGKPAVVASARDITLRNKYEQQILSLHRHAVALQHAKDEAAVADATLDAVEAVIGCRLISYLKVTGKGLFAIGSRGNPILGIPLPIDGKGITVKAAREQKTVLVDDIRESHDFFRGTSDSLSELAVPVILNGAVIGVINLESTSLGSFSETDVKIVETLALHVATAHDRIDTLKKTLEQEAEKTKELLNGADRIIGMVRHDLRSPLQTIRTINYLIKQHPEKACEFTQSIDDGVDYASKILEDLKSMTKPSEFHPMPTYLNDLIDQSLEAANTPRNITVVKQLGQLPKLSLDPFRIRRVVDNLVKNAIEAMMDGGTLTLRTSLFDGFVEVKVSDTGVGLSEKDQTNLFKPFYTTKKSGTGLGLIICKQAVEMHGGSISLESGLGSGSTFTIRIPT
jgi:PAS domain S-box-containing protein